MVTLENFISTIIISQATTYFSISAFPTEKNTETADLVHVELYSFAVMLAMRILLSIGHDNQQNFESHFWTTTAIYLAEHS